MRSIGLALTLTTLAIIPAEACPDGQSSNDLGFCQPNWSPPPPPPHVPTLEELRKKAEDTVKAAVSTAIKASFPTAHLMMEAAKRTGNPEFISATSNLQMIGTKLDKETQAAITNALTNPEKAVRDAAQNYVKAANDIVDAANATARYADRTIKGYGEVLSKAESRVREGKVVDAIWHISTDRLRMENDNSAALMKESELARQAAQTLAASAGGPAGSAAFAAWYAYNASGGNVEKALLAGAYSYAVSSGGANINEWPANTIGQTAKKAAATAAMRGLSVAAAGGTQQDALNAALQGGGSVIVQSGSAYVTKEYIGPAKAKADSFCMNAVEVSCGDAMQWVDDTKKDLDKYKTIANELPNTVVSSDGQWSVSWNKYSVLNPKNKAPNVVLTYIGQGSIYRDTIVKLASVDKQLILPRKAITPPPMPRTFSVSISSNGRWIDNYAVGEIRGYSNTIEFYVDGEYASTHYLHRPFDSFDLDLTKGTHILLYKARVRTANGMRIAGECSIKFTVSGVELFRPSIRFEPISDYAGRVADCALNAD